MAHDVFICYASDNKVIADGVCAALEGHRIRCWIAPRDVLPGRKFAEVIVEAIHAARVFVLVFSNASNASVQVQREVDRAVSCGLPILPLRVEDVVPSDSLAYYLAGQHWLDALTPPLERHLTRLCEAIAILLEPTPRGGFPVAEATDGEAPTPAEPTVVSTDTISAKAPADTPPAPAEAPPTAPPVASQWPPPAPLHTPAAPPPPPPKPAAPPADTPADTPAAPPPPPPKPAAPPADKGPATAPVDTPAAPPPVAPQWAPPVPLHTPAAPPPPPPRPTVPKRQKKAVPAKAVPATNAEAVTGSSGRIGQEAAPRPATSTKGLRFPRHPRTFAAAVGVGAAWVVILVVVGFVIK